MGHADGEFHAMEIGIIREKMGKLYPFSDKLDNKLDEAIQEYNDFDKADLKILFRDTFNHFTNVKFAQKYKVYADMYDIINADGKIEMAEEKALLELKEIIDLSAAVSHQK